MIIDKYIKSGLSIIPVKSDKRPLIDWKPYQKRLATPEEYKLWFSPIAAVCGAVSGGLTCIDFDDGGSALQSWTDIVTARDASILGRVACQKTPSGGYHIFFKTKNIEGNKKLAQKYINDELTVLIETRGEGGYFLISPSKGYELKRGDPTALAELTRDETGLLMSAGYSLNEVTNEHNIPEEIAGPIRRTGLSPFDDYDSRNTAPALLEKHGWKIVGESKNVLRLCRPGKQTGISATWNHVPDRLYVFTSSTQFDPQKTYKTSSVYAILEHNADYVAAAKQLSSMGYGEKRDKRKPVDVDSVHTIQILRPSDFRQRIYDFYTKPKDSGCPVGLKEFDQLLRFDTGYLNVITGIPTHGKSAFLDFLTMLLAKAYGWNFAVFSPENYPLEIHHHKLAELYHEQDMFGVERYVLDEAIDFIDERYYFIDATEDEVNLDNLMATAMTVKNVKGFVIDPWNEIELNRPRDTNDSDFTGVCLRKLRKFARKNNICVFVVAHPAKMYRKKDDDEFPVPSMYDISGSSNWYNKADNGIVVYRNFLEGTVDVHVKKVKYKNYGRLGTVSLKYSTDSGVYREMNDDDGKSAARRDMFCGID